MKMPKWRRKIEEGAKIEGKTWRDVKVIAGRKVRWCCFVEVLCPEVE
jgi:hypothetical protein